jgi:hypothetical protein
MNGNRIMLLYGPCLCRIFYCIFHVLGFKTIIEEYTNIIVIVVYTRICFNFRDNVKRKYQILCSIKNFPKLSSLFMTDLCQDKWAYIMFIYNGVLHNSHILLIDQLKALASYAILITNHCC